MVPRLLLLLLLQLQLTLLGIIISQLRETLSPV